ncbi:MAG: hypothetical protein HFI74_09060 [Lachnospiraceae bacterium]|nr:hypothetical protein [Lachnospiraceae bacterium]
MNVNLYVKSSIQNYSATAINSTQYEQKNKETSSTRNKDSVEISQSGRLASTFDIDEDIANRIETAIQNADIPALLEEFKEKQGSLPVDEEWHYRKIVDPDGKIYSLTYVESLLRQYQSAENTIEEYYAKAHQDNLSQGSITDGMNYLSMKYTEFGLITGSPYYRADMSEAERKMALHQEKALLLGGRVMLGDPYALASSGGIINIKDADQIAHQAARDRIDELINEYKKSNGIAF